MDPLIADIKAETKSHIIMEYINPRLYATGVWNDLFNSK